MGHWSEWIDGDLTGLTSRGYSLALRASPDGRYSVAEDADVNFAVGQAVAQARTAPGATADTASVGGALAYVRGFKANTWNPQTSGDAAVGQQLYTVIPVTDPLTYRNWFPSLLYSLTEGTDYAAIPGKDPLRDDDAYVEYEAPTNALVGWEATWATSLVVSNIPDSVGSNAPAPEPFFPATYPLRFALGAASYDPKTEIPDGISEWSGHPYGWGSTALELAPLEVPAGDSSTDLELPIHLLDPTNPAFCLAIQTGLHNPEATPPTMPNYPQNDNIAGESSASLTQEARLTTFAEGSYVVTVGPKFYTQMPRWRYWIPVDPAPEYYPGRKINPLMDIDGLGRSVDVNFSG